MYGAFTSNVDMRSGAPAFGTPENTKANMHRRPARAALPAALPHLERRMPPTRSTRRRPMRRRWRLWGAVLGGGNLIYHAAGWLEGGLTASFEKLVIDVEMLQNMMEFLRRSPFDEDDSASMRSRRCRPAAISSATEHTLARYATAFYQPMLSNWQNYESLAGGRRPDALERATEMWQQALRDYQEPVMDPAIREELDAYVARRREEIGAGEP